MSNTLGGTFDGVTSIRIDSDAAGIQVLTAAADAPVDVELRDRRGLPLAAEHLDLQRHGDQLLVRVRTVRDGRWRRGRVLDARLRVTAPLAVALDVHSDAGAVKVDGRDAPVTIEAAAGAVSLDRVEGSVDVRTNAGQITMSDSHGNATLRSDAGAIRVERQHADRLELSTSAGAIDARELRVQHVHASSDVGSTNLRFEQAPASVDASCAVGAVKVSLPRAGSYRIDQQTGMLGRATIDGLASDPTSSRTVRVSSTGLGTVSVIGE